MGSPEEFTMEDNPRPVQRVVRCAGAPLAAPCAARNRHSRSQWRWGVRCAQERRAQAPAVFGMPADACRSISRPLQDRYTVALLSCDNNMLARPTSCTGPAAQPAPKPLFRTRSVVRKLTGTTHGVRVPRPPSYAPPLCLQPTPALHTHSIQ